MKNKNLKILGAILLILIILLAWKIYSPQIFPESSPYLDSIRSVSKQSVNQIIIKKNSGSITLQKEQGAWLVNGKHADTDKIDDLFKSIYPVSSPDLISRSDKRFTEFELTDKLATKISLDKKKTLLLGKIDYPNIYARLDGQNDIFLLKNPSTVSTDPGDWYDRTITKIDEASIKSLTFKTNDEKFTLIHDKNGWKDGGNNKYLNKDKAASIISTLSSFKADNIPGQKAYNISSNDPDATWTIEKGDGREVLEFYKQDDNNYLVKRNSDGQIFSISQAQAGPFLELNSKFQ